MQIIPVIDLLNGVVVHAKQGDRQNYQPIQSQLTTSHQAVDIVAALLALYPFKQLYIADLDAIQKLGGAYTNNYNVIANIQLRFPSLNIWVDAGISCRSELDVWNMSGVNLIIGSENFAQLEDYLVIKEALQDHFMLSLDFMPNGYKGPTELLENPSHWPKDVIVMSLAHVGSNLGVDMQRLQFIKTAAPQAHLYAAGGVRSPEDLIELEKMGIRGVLVASALHEKQLNQKQLSSFRL